DRCFHNVSCLVVEMGKPRRFGMIEFSTLKSAERIDDSGRFVWPENRAPETIGIYNLSKEEFEAASRGTDDKNRLLDMLHLHTKNRYPLIRIPIECIRQPLPPDPLHPPPPPLLRRIRLRHDRALEAVRGRFLQPLFAVGHGAYLARQADLAEGDGLL